MCVFPATFEELLGHWSLAAVTMRERMNQGACSQFGLVGSCQRRYFPTTFVLQWKNFSSTIHLGPLKDAHIIGWGAERGRVVKEG